MSSSQMEQLVLESSPSFTGRFLMVRNEAGAFWLASRESKPVRRNNSERKYLTQTALAKSSPALTFQGRIRRLVAAPEAEDICAPEAEGL
jgi:hypothetical protein